MSKLIFITGVMGSGKSQKLLYDRKNDPRLQHKRVLMLTCGAPADAIVSRSGERLEAKPFREIRKGIMSYKYVMVDEAQWLTTSDVEYLSKLAANGVFIKCYGIKSDSNGKVYEGAAALFGMADYVSDLNASRDIQCWTEGCTSPAVLHAKVSNLDTKEDYKAVCRRCFYHHKEAQHG